MSTANSTFTETSILAALNKLAVVLTRDGDSRELMSNAVQVFREIFSVDRVWLIYPCDPNTPSCRVYYEDVRPNHPGLRTMDEKLDVTPGVADLFRDALAVDEPVIQIQGAGKTCDADVLKRFSLCSRMSIALKMKNDRPWLLEMHQGDYRRQWTETERALFQYAAQRLCEAHDSSTLLNTIKRDIAKRQKLESELTLSEQRFRSFFQHSSVSLWLVDISDVIAIFSRLRSAGVTDLNSYFIEHPGFENEIWRYIPVIDVNRATLQLFEANTKERLIRSVQRLYTRKTVKSLRSFFLAVFSGLEHHSLEAEYRTFKGNDLDAIVHIDVLPGEEDLVLVSIVDISSQKMLEVTLFDSREQYRKLIETANDAILIADAETGIIMQANQSAELLTGYSRDTLTGMHQTALHPVGEQRLAADLFREHGSSTELKDRPDPALINLLCADGQQIPVEISASITEVKGRKIVQGIFRDLRARIAGEEHLRLLATVTEQTDDSVIITDVNGEISYVNPAFERVTGYTLAEVVGRRPDFLKSGEQDDAFYKLLWDTVRSGEVWHGNLVNRAKDGSFFEEDAVIAPVKDYTGKIKNYVAVKRDKTRQNSLEKQVRQAQKMQAIGTLAGGIAHDFNNILTAIMGFAELSLLQCSDNILLQNNLNEIIKGSDRAGKLIDQILTFSRQTEKNVAALRLSIVIKEALKLLRSSLPANIDIIQNIDQELMVRVDPTQIHQVLMNLCSNAYQAIGADKGWIKVSIHRVSLRPREGVEIGNLSHGSYVCLTVEDSGEGISVDNHGRIFEPYFTTRKQNQGTGLGLSVVHGIVNDHGGAITVQSTVGVGSCFTVYLPEVSSNEGTASELRETLVPGAGRVLVVDDEQQIVDYEVEVLKRAGYDPVGFIDSLTAMGALITSSEEFDLVVTDMAMPDLTGLQLFRKIQKIRVDLPVLLCTGYSEHVTEASSKKLGVSGYLAKPFTAEQFCVEVKRVLEQAPRSK